MYITKKRFVNVLLLGLMLLLVNCNKDETQEPGSENKVWRFVVVGDTHVTTNSDTISEMIPYFLQDSIDLILLCGDIVEGGKMTNAADLEKELMMWEEIFKPLYDKGIDIYPIRGNHEDDATDDIAVWNKFFSGTKALPQNGPTGEQNLSYSFGHKNAFFVGLDHYVNIHRVNQDWVNTQLESTEQPHIFVFGHEAAFKVFHSDCLDDYQSERNTFWQSMAKAGVKAYFCGHDHFFDATLIEDSDGNTSNNIYQVLVGGGGGWLMSRYAYNGENSPYTPEQVYHRKEHGYMLVEISGEKNTDLNVKMTWKERLESGNTVSYISTQNIIQYTLNQ